MHAGRPLVTALTALVIASGASPLCAQGAPPPRDQRADARPAGTSIVRGRVVAAGLDVATPVRDARVTITSPADAVDPVFTDGSGRFEIKGLAAGRYTLTAEKTGFVKTRFGAKHDLDPPVPIDVVDGGIVDGVEIRMPRGAAISGRIVDDLGEPVVGAVVSAGVLRSGGGESRFTSVARPASDTDDRGEYRIGGLAAGRYFVAVAGAGDGSAAAGAPLEWARTAGWGRTFYFASAGVAGATPVVLGTGEERTGVDIVVAPARPARLTLSLVDAAGAPATGLINLFLPGDAPGSFLANRGVPLSPANPRMTQTLEPGEWVAVAIGKSRAIAHVRLAGGDETSLMLSLGSGARIAGRLIFEGSSAAPTPAAIRLGVRGAGPDASAPGPALSDGPVPVKADGSFEMNGVIGTIEIQPASPLRGWMLRAVNYGGRNLLEEPLSLVGGEDISGVQVIFTDQFADLSGTTVDGDGRPAPGCAVAVFPDSGSPRFISLHSRLVRADQSGRFIASDLPAGSYLAAAMPDIDADTWLSQDSLKDLEKIAAHVKVAVRDNASLRIGCTAP